MDKIADSKTKNWDGMAVIQALIPVGLHEAAGGLQLDTRWPS